MLEVADTATRALKGYKTSSKLGAAISTLKVQTKRLERHLYALRKLEYAVKRYHTARPGNMHDRIDLEIEEDCEHWVKRSHPRWTTVDYEEIREYMDAYPEKYPG